MEKIVIFVFKMDLFNDGSVSLSRQSFARTWKCYAKVANVFIFIPLGLNI